MSPAHLLLGRCLVIGLTIGALGPIEAAAAAADSKHVLVLYSTSRDSPMATAGDRELPRILEQGLEQDLVFFPEYIDQGRFPDPGYQSALSDFLRVKYQGQRIDLIMAIQAAAVEFVTERRQESFPNIPFVFLTLSSAPERGPNSTGVIAPLDLARTIALAGELQPELHNVFVVSGAGVPDREYERLARTQLQWFEPRLAITYLSGLPTKDLEVRLASLPERSMVYYLVVYQDGAGKAFSPSEYSARVAAIARAPTYTWSDALMGRGILGGSLLDRVAMMEAAGAVALRVLHGESADHIPLSSPNLTVSQVDWRQLRRWGISESRVPRDTRVLFKELSVWDRYKVYILGTGAVLLAQALLIGGLLVQRRRRRQAEEQVRNTHERVRDLGARLLHAQDTERSRIARELHDDISQQIALLSIDLELLSDAVPTDTEALAGEALDRVQEIARSVHELSHQLHPAKLRLIGLVGALQALQRELSRSGQTITFTHEQVPSSLPPDLTVTLFRVVQEALQNAIKHSRARTVSVHLRGGADGLALTVADDGAGFAVDEAWGKGLGLMSIGERVEAIGGTFAIQSTPGGGTSMTITAPLAIAEETAEVAGRAAP